MAITQAAQVRRPRGAITAHQEWHVRLGAESGARARPWCTRVKALGGVRQMRGRQGGSSRERREPASRVQASAAAAATVEDPRVEEIMDSLKWDSSSGLLVAIAQNADTGDVMMQGFADRRAVAKTLLTGRATFFSRSRK